MKYYISSYGYDSEIIDKKFNSRERALVTLKKMAKRWCRNHDVDFNETEYSDGDDRFYYGLEYEGICVYQIYEIPKFKNKVEELLWKAMIDMDMADNASENYKFSLSCCDVDCYVYEAKEKIKEAIELLNKSKGVIA